MLQFEADLEELYRRGEIDPAAIPPDLTRKIIQEYIKEFGESLVMILFAGSRIRQDWQFTSDLDVHVVHSGEWYQKRLSDGSTDSFGIRLEISVDPLPALYSWVSSSRAYAHFFGGGKVIFPRRVPTEMLPVMSAARRHYDEPKMKRVDTEEHYAGYLRCRRILADARLSVGPERQLSIVHAQMLMALLRLTLAGEYYPQAHRLVTQLRSVDERFARQYETCLTAPLELAVSACADLLEMLRPTRESFVGARLVPARRA